jgi:hypothetical protein
MNAYHYWDSPLKKGDKGGCFLCSSNPVTMILQPEDVQKPTPHSLRKGGIKGVVHVSITRLIYETPSIGISILNITRLIYETP